MKTVHIITNLESGGAELMLERLLRYDRENKLGDSFVISLMGKGVVGPRLEKIGIPVYDLGASNLYSLILATFKAKRILQRLSPDLVQTWMYHADFIGGLAARLSGNKNVIWGIRSTDIRQGGSKATLIVRRLCSILSYIIPKKIVCVAEVSRKLHVGLGYDASKFVVIPNGFDIDRFYLPADASQVFRLNQGLNPNNLVVGSIGRFSPLKDHSTFIKAAAIVAGKFPNVKFMLVGRELTWSNSILRQEIRDTGCSDRFLLLGQRDDIPACLNAMDVFCLHSLSEGFPNVLGEAMAAGLPAVTSNVGDAGYLLNLPQYVVPPRDPVALSLALENLVALPAEARHALGDQGRKRIAENFTMAVVIERYADLYSSVVMGSH